MRIWDIAPRCLCRNHLLGEHRELHAIWSIITRHQPGYQHHPETLRWVGKLKALYHRHAQQVAEMRRRGYQHHSPLDKRQAQGQKQQDEYVNSAAEQSRLLKRKKCACLIK